MKNSIKIREKDSKEIEKRKDGEQGRGKDNQTKQMMNPDWESEVLQLKLNTNDTNGLKENGHINAENYND